jgi:predicted lipase
MSETTKKPKAKKIVERIPVGVLAQTIREVGTTGGGVVFTGNEVQLISIFSDYLENINKGFDKSLFRGACGLSPL